MYTHVHTMAAMVGRGRPTRRPTYESTATHGAARRADTRVRVHHKPLLVLHISCPGTTSARVRQPRAPTAEDGSPGLSTRDRPRRPARRCTRVDKQHHPGRACDIQHTRRRASTWRVPRNPTVTPPGRLAQDGRARNGQWNPTRPCPAQRMLPKLVRPPFRPRRPPGQARGGRECARHGFRRARAAGVKSPKANSAPKAV